MSSSFCDNRVLVDGREACTWSIIYIYRNNDNKMTERETDRDRERDIYRERDRESVRLLQ